MDILLNLPYTPLDDLYIGVERIKYGWMDLCIAVNGKSFTYGASYLSDPVDDLLTAAVSIIKKDRLAVSHYNLKEIGDFIYVTHELEPGLVTWLFRYTDNKLTLIIWEDMPTDFDELIEARFESQSDKVQKFDAIPDLTQELLFALNGSAVPFIKALINTFTSIDKLERFEDDSNGHDWGFTYSIDNLNFLKEWLSKNDALIN